MKYVGNVGNRADMGHVQSANCKLCQEYKATVHKLQSGDAEAINDVENARRKFLAADAAVRTCKEADSVLKSRLLQNIYYNTHADNRTVQQPI